MIWSLFRISAFFLLIAVLSYLAALVAEVDGMVKFVLGDTEYMIRPLTFVVLLLSMIPVVWVAYFLFGLCTAMIRFVTGDETALSRYLNRNRQRQGFKALADSMVALASGQPKRALIKAEIAQRNLRRPELTGLLAAQAAERLGDSRRALEVYKEMLSNDQTRFAGLAGILKHKHQEGDFETALAVARRAFELKPSHEEIQKYLFQLQLNAEDWSGARTTLQAKHRHKYLAKNDFKRQSGILALAESRAKAALGETARADSLTIEANKLAPGLAPAAIEAAKVRIKAGERRTATRILANAWNQAPHPDIAAQFAEIEPHETSERRQSRFRRLVAKTIDHPESRLVMAELALRNSDYAQARHELGTTHVTHPTVRSLLILAAIERGEGSSDSVVGDILSKAVSAPRGPQWVCNSCHMVNAAWSPLCTDCKAFDTLSWSDAGKADRMHPSSTQLLPFLQSDEQTRLLADSAAVPTQLPP